MGNEWTRLTHEAKVHGGPDGLRHFYKVGGRAEGVIGTLIVQGVIGGVLWLGNKINKHFVTRRITKKIADLEAQESKEKPLNPIEPSTERERKS